MKVQKLEEGYDVQIRYEAQDLIRRLTNFNDPRKNKGAFADIMTEYWLDNGKRAGSEREKAYFEVWTELRKATEECKDPSYPPHHCST